MKQKCYLSLKFIFKTPFSLSLFICKLGVHFRAIYSYKPVCKGEMGLKEGELVVCKERDRNGWMLGMKPKTKEEGWFPAVYVDAVKASQILQFIFLKNDFP